MSDARAGAFAATLPAATVMLVLDVASRTIIWSLVKQVRVGLVPIFHGLHRRTALER